MVSPQVFVGSSDRTASGSQASSSSQATHSAPVANGPVSSDVPSSLDRVLQARAGYIEEALQMLVHPLHLRSPYAVVRGLETEVNCQDNSPPIDYSMPLQSS